jgi:haloacid dehalogenase superfamily, subfamily IA, variant 1 with third motif having Dx(3-4)D or Dx(3-4)E
MNAMAVLEHVLFDFFGTLVAYSESRVEQGFQRSYEILVRAGAQVDYSGFLEWWSRTFEEFDMRAQLSLDEYSMDEVCEKFLQRVLPKPPDAEVIARFRDAYLMEWNKGVEYIPGVSSLLADLSEQFTLALVTNTHHAGLVHDHLKTMDVAEYFATVVTSVEHGKRKPSRCIFESALERSRGKPETSVYVGDSYSADYLGAVEAGLSGLLIDPEHRYDVPRSHRLTHVLETRALLAD